MLTTSSDGGPAVPEAETASTRTAYLRSAVKSGIVCLVPATRVSRVVLYASSPDFHCTI